MITQFKSKEFENRLSETAIASKIRLERFLATVEQLKISTIEFELVRRDERGLLVAEKSLISDYQDRQNCFIDMDKFTGLKSISVNVQSRIYAHKWNRNIESMHLNGNTILQVLSILSEFTKLKSLTCYARQSLMPKSLPENIKKQLTYLSVHSLPSADFLEGFSNLAELKISMLDNLQLDDIPMLGKVKRFTGDACQSTNLDFFSKMPNVNYIDIRSPMLADISYVKKLHQLKELCVANSCISSIEALKDTSIEVLDITNNMVEDISPLATMPLVYLDIAQNPITDLSALKNQAGLELLHLKETWVTDLSPILELENLKELSLDFENLEDTKQLLLFTLMSAIAQFERDVIADRTREGLAAARARGRFGGRPKVNQCRNGQGP